MGNAMMFLGGVVALAFLGFLLLFELSRESMLFVYVLSFLIILTLGAMLLSLRGAIGRAALAAAGRFRRGRPPHITPEIPGGENPESPKPSRPPGKVSNPMLKDLMERVMKERKRPRQGKGMAIKEAAQEPAKASGGPGLLKRLRGLGKWRAGPEAGDLAQMEMDELEEEAEGAEDRRLAGALEDEAEGKPKRKGRPVAGAPPKGEDRGESATPCQICGSRKNVHRHYIVPIEKGGSEGKGNIIMLCGNHRRQAEQGIYSENLLKRMRDI